MDEGPPVQPERERAIDLAYRAVNARDRTVAELRTYLEHKRVEPTAIEVSVREGEVHVAGELATSTDVAVCERLLEKVPGVVSVQSSLTFRVQNGN